MPTRVRLAAICCLLASSTAAGEDWPMWRFDAGRTAASPTVLSDTLHLQWTRTFTPRRQVWDDPLNLDLMPYDLVFEPVVANGRMFVGFNDKDKLVAFDTKNGAILWTFYTGAPVRLPPVATAHRVYFCSDDGYVYCTNAVDGTLVWKRRGGPNSQKAIGNRRLASAWPARGGPVLRDGTLYFAASIWPFMGTFIYALNAETGEVVWINDSTGAQYIKQPHSAPSFAGVAPQGALVATKDALLVPGGRSVPAVFDRSNGKLRYFELNAGGKGIGGSLVMANDSEFFVHTRERGVRAFNLTTGVKKAFTTNEPVLAGKSLYSAEVADEKPHVRCYGDGKKLEWEIAADGRGDLILAGGRLYAAGSERLTAIQLPEDGHAARIVWQSSVNGNIRRLLAANGQLFAVTTEGEIHCFGPEGVDPVLNAEEATPLNAGSSPVADEILVAGDSEGYALWYGADDEQLLDSVATRSPFVQLSVVEADPVVVGRMRRRYDEAGLYGRITCHHARPLEFRAPRYIANVVVVGRELTREAAENLELVATFYQSVRPYGGVLQLLVSESEREKLAEAIEGLELEQASVERAPHGIVVRRVGALPGSADWTHQHGNIANTVKSNDSRVKLPLGVLWYGGSSNMDVLPRHGHGPPEQVVGGRLFVQGMNSLSARDVYTGRVLWKREFEDLGTFDVYYDSTFKNTPLNPAYNQVHIPGANSRGTNYVVAEDRVYILEGPVCHVLDPATGKTIRDIEMPQGEADETVYWGFIGVYKDVLIGGAGFANYRGRHGLSFAAVDALLKGNRAGFGSKSFDRAGSAAIIGFDRHSGETLWRSEARHSFWHNGIVAGNDRLFLLDKNPQPVEDALRRRGKSLPETYRILSLDYRTGEPVWEVEGAVFGTWLGYSEKHDLLLQAGAAASDRLYAEVGKGMAVYVGENGSVKWRNDDLNYAGPCIIHNELIITNANSYRESAGAFSLLDGKQKMVENPLTGQLQPWKIQRAYGCNNIIASENLLTFRSGASGFYDLLTESGTGNFGGFKSGCTSNLVVANGVLNAPDYTRTCSCAYQNQTSLALVHMPEMEMWSVNTAAELEFGKDRVRSVGVNFGAPGDRRGDDGVLWLEHPVVGGDSPPLYVDVEGPAEYYRHHATSFGDAELPWVHASGVRNATTVRIALDPRPKHTLKTGVPVAHADDDAEESPSGSVSLSSSDLELGEHNGNQVVGIRFNNLNIAKGADVRNAFIQFTCDESSDVDTRLRVFAEDAGQSQRFGGGKKNISKRPRTREFVEWTPAPWTKSGSHGDAERTPDVSRLVRSVVSRPDWSPGNSITFIIDGTGKRVASTSPGKDAAKLIADADELAIVRSRNAIETPHRVKLCFADPEEKETGERVFDVYLQGERVLENFDIAAESDGTSRAVIRTFEGIPIRDELEITFQAKRGEPILSGVVIQRVEEQASSGGS